MAAQVFSAQKTARTNLLTERKTVLNEFPLRTEVATRGLVYQSNDFDAKDHLLAVVEEDGPVVGDKLITQGADLSIQNKTYVYD